MPAAEPPPVAASQFEVGELSSLFEADVLADGWVGAEPVMPAELVAVGAEAGDAERPSDDGRRRVVEEPDSLPEEVGRGWHWKTVAAWTAGAMSGVGLAVVVTAYVLNQPGKVASVADADRGPVEQAAVEPGAAEDQQDVVPGAADPADGAETPVTPESEATPDSPPSDATTPSSDATTPPSDATTPPSDAATPPSDAATSPTDATQTPETGAAQAETSDRPAGGAAPGKNAAPAGSGSPASGVPAGWQVPSYASLFETPILSTDALTGPTNALGPDAAAVGGADGSSADGSSAEGGSAPKGGPDASTPGDGPVQPQEAYQPQDVAARLGTRVPGLEVDKMPLGQFADLVGQLAGLPVALDPTALAVVSISPRKVVSVRESNRTCEELLSAALKPLRLTHEARNGCVWITVAEGPEAVREVRHAADDLLKGGLTSEQLQTIVRRLVAPETWTESGGSGRLDVAQGKLVVRQTPTVHLQVLQLLEGLRSARGLPTRSKFPAQLFDVQWRERWGERWSRPLQMDAWSEQPLVACWSDVQRRTGAMVLVDWPSLVQQGWGPQSKVTWGVRDRSLMEAIDEFAERHGWFVARMPTGVLWVTSRRQADAMPRLELHRVGAEPNVDGEAVWEEFRRQLDPETAALPYEYYFDPPGRVLVLRAPASLQQRFADYLADTAPHEVAPTSAEVAPTSVR
ncbi:MAG: hypothetical protein U0795_12825 [Pirellulales bacterium]